MGWEWFSAGNISDDQLRQAIDRLKETAWVHDTINFPGSPQPDDILTRLKKSVDDGFLKVACNILADGAIEQPFFFQKSKWLTAQLNTDVWNVSFGFDQQLLSSTADQAECRTFIRDNMTPILEEFMATVGVSNLYSVEYGSPDGNPTDSKIGRLQTLGLGEQWNTVGAPQTFSGTEAIHKFWGKELGGVYKFMVYTIERI